MKITVKHRYLSDITIINVEEFQKKAQIIFDQIVVPQIENAKNKSLSLTPAQKAKAKAAAKKAGRPYPNLVDNAAAKQKGK